MSIRISAVLDRATVAELLEEVTPIKIDLGEENRSDRSIEIEMPDSIELVEGHGIRIHTTAMIVWTVAGVAVPFNIQSITVMVRPMISEPPALGRLTFLPVIEEADLKNVPSLIDQSIVSHVNARLAARAPSIGWTFAKTLAFKLKLPQAMAPLAHFEMSTGPAVIELGSTEIRISVSLPMHLTRS